MRKITAIAGLALYLLAGTVSAGQDSSATDSLLAHLQAISHLQGQFEQRQYGEDEALLVESSGAFKLLRPAHFSWEIRAPDSQLIVANPLYIWHHDRDLETVTRRPVSGNAQASPLQVLAGDEAVLLEQYTVEQTGTDSFTLLPLGTEQGFKRLSVTFAGNTITGMEILDNLSQRVVVVFRELDPQTPLTDKDFDFTPPAGDVDLFYYDE